MPDTKESNFEKKLNFCNKLEELKLVSKEISDEKESDQKNELEDE